MSILDRHPQGPSAPTANAGGGGGELLHIAMIGTRGAPARYGGFETCVEEVGARLADRGHRVTVYCRRTAGETAEPLATFRGMDLVHLPAMRKRTLETLSHTALSVSHLAAHPADVALVFNAANAPLLPAIRARRIPVATHVDGLEWKRAKWGPSGQRYYRAVEKLAVRWSDALIADAVGIQDYYADHHGVDTTLITYGAPVITGGGDPARLAGLGLEPRGYHLVVARFEPENHVDVIVDGYVRSRATKPLVVVGSAPYADEHTARIRSLADDRVRLLGGIWDQDLLDQLYAGADTYLHGHSVGGTNPSLLRAIGASAAVSAFDVSFNREVVAGAGVYWKTADDVRAAVEAAEDDPEATRARALAAGERAAHYDWDVVADGYEALSRRLAARRSGALVTSTGISAPAIESVASSSPPLPSPAPPVPDAGAVKRPGGRAVAVAAVLAPLLLLAACSGDDAASGPSATSGSSAGATPPASSSGAPSTSPTPSSSATAAPGDAESGSAPESPGTAPAPVADGSVGVTTLAPVSAGEPAAFGDGLVARITATEDVDLVGSGPGEVSGPGVAVTVALDNGTASEVDLSSLVVNASVDGEPTPASAADPAAPATGVLAPGASGEGTWVFAVPAGSGASLRVEVTSTSSAAVVVSTPETQHPTAPTSTARPPRPDHPGPPTRPASGGRRRLAASAFSTRCSAA